jgi:hypothetical protein
MPGLHLEIAAPGPLSLVRETAALYILALGQTKLGESFL